MSRKKSDIDATDLKLISELENNPREKYAFLADRLGIDQSTVKRRMNRLLGEGTISFYSALNLAAVGFQSAMLGFNVSKGYAKSVAHELAGHELMFVSIASGRFDILAWTAYKDPEMLFKLVSIDLGKISNITNIEVFTNMKMMKYSFNLLGGADFKPISSKMYRQLDRHDWNLLTYLEDNPRMAISHLATKLGITRQTATIRLQRLLDEDVVRIHCVVSHAMIGNQFSIGIFLKVEPGTILEVSERIAAYKFVNTAIAISGGYDLLVFATFKDAEEMSDFLINELETIHSIKSSEIILYPKSISMPISARDAKIYMQNH